MRCLRSTASLALTVALTAACAPDAVIGASVPESPPVFDFDPAAAVPQILSATVVGRLDNNNSIVRITFTDNAEDEWLTSAYFTATASWGGAVTQNIDAMPGTGERSVDVPAPNGFTTVRLRHGWKGGPSGLLFSSFSDPATIGNVTTTTRRKGR